jgi:hypothetical protein
LTRGRLAVGITALLAGAGAGLAGPGCHSTDGPGVYEPCRAGCAAGRCEWVGRYLSPTGFACLTACGADADCPATKTGGGALCVSGLCRPAACRDDELPDPADPAVACDQGNLRRCTEIPSPPCSVCPVCGAADFCDLDTETCRPMKQHGQPCTTSAECPSGDCRLFTRTDGSVLFDGKRYCRFPTGDPCWEGDPCFCSGGACSFSCRDDSACEGTTCTSAGRCYRACTSSAATCGPSAICDNVSAVTTPVFACTATGPRPPRAEGVPCDQDAECISSTCCPAATGETWGHCAGAAGC